VAASTTDPAKTLTRLLPGLKEEYYLIRRRKKYPRPFDPLKKAFKYRFTELAPNALAIWLSNRNLRDHLQALGFDGQRLQIVDHHTSHAAAAAFCSGFHDGLALTLDGVGDGLCGSLWSFSATRLDLIKTFPARVSLGIFFEHVTNLMNMRELEDEGKVMALANYAYPIPDDENPLMEIILVRDGALISDYSSTRMHRQLKRILWRYPSEQFAAMAQRVLEKCALEIVKGIPPDRKIKRLAVAGGVFSNIKMNMKIAALDEIERIFVFPHMGDGGLALGAAMKVNFDLYGIGRYALPDLYLGPQFSRDQIIAVCEQEIRKGTGLCYTVIAGAPEKAARLILDGQIVLWFQGRMEIGPRALGNRSILARPDSSRIKDRLNILLKKRVWYQPFCPSILIEDAPELLHTEGQKIEDNPFMTMAFPVREKHLKLMEGVMNIDGTCRPQFVAEDNPPYRSLLSFIKESLGCGVVLNTSFNIHGEPLVCTPAEAVDMLKRAHIRYLFMEDVFVENLDAKP